MTTKAELIEKWRKERDDAGNAAIGHADLGDIAMMYRRGSEANTLMRCIDELEEME